jgi:hypothetical protein
MTKVVAQKYSLHTYNNAPSPEALKLRLSLLFFVLRAVVFNAWICAPALKAGFKVQLVI